MVRPVGESRSRRLFARSLIVVQVMVSLVLLSAASLFIGHLADLRNVGLGFDRYSVLLVTLTRPGPATSRHNCSSRIKRCSRNYRRCRA